MAQFPCFLSPLVNSLLLPFLTPLYLLGNPPSCDRICPPWSPVACKLNSPFPSPCPYTPNSKIPTPPGFLTSKYTFIRMASRTWLKRSSSIVMQLVPGAQNLKIPTKNWRVYTQFFLLNFSCLNQRSYFDVSYRQIQSDETVPLIRQTSVRGAIF